MRNIFVVDPHHEGTSLEGHRKLVRAPRKQKRRKKVKPPDLEVGSLRNKEPVYKAKADCSSSRQQ
jgi:hypothetical protein